MEVGNVPDVAVAITERLVECQNRDAWWVIPVLMAAEQPAEKWPMFSPNAAAVDCSFVTNVLNGANDAHR